ncbi:laccase-1 [Biomphalaria pfeifferi]|uniref:Laccase-1 n=1 Tax=Biomphalaria pfeifferi TaxID=112525 RepID=A0AAD8FEK6_BIOPF|nr:laccase-1 [Biomphalaria pfeifferi]
MFVLMLVTLSLVPRDTIAQPDTWNFHMEDYKDHPCRRPCEENGLPHVCQYEWIVENYFVMSKACHQCPFNLDHCSAPHCIAADGYAKGIRVANRMMPGPAIEVCLGDTIEVTVNNHLESSEGTSIHWHGIMQYGSQFMDGVAMVTQCPISFNSKFTYRFNASSAGTHYWHGHAGTQRADGLYGPLIVRQPPSQEIYHTSYDYDLPEHVITITDWTIDMMTNRLAKYVHFDNDNKPRLMLINGKGQYQGYVNQTTNTTYYTPRAVFHVDADKKYRFRLISNGIMNCPIQFSIDNHTMLFIASDGNYLKPFVADSLTIHSGERYDFILFADKEHIASNFWIRARGYNNCATRKASQTAILRYSSSNSTTDLPKGNTAWEDGIREGVHLNAAFPVPPNDTAEIRNLKAELPDDDILTSTPDKQFYLAIDFVPIDNLRSHNIPYYPFNSSVKFYSPQINWISSQMPPSPPLSQFDDVPEELFCNAEKVKKQCTKEWCACVHKYDLNLGDLVELIILDEGKPSHAYHPVHLHGHRFRVLAMERLGDSTSLAEVKELDRAGKINRTTTQAPLKDTIIIPDGGYTVLRFRADNPGIWLLHCHVEFHAETGMALVFQVGTKEQLPKRPKNFPKCGSWKFEGYEENDGTPASNQPNITVNVPVPKVEVTCRSNSNSLHTSSIMLMSVAFMTILKSLYF